MVVEDVASLERRRRAALGTGIADNYDRTAAAYEQVVRYNAHGSARLVASLPDVPVDRILDVGCGTGFAALRAIARHGATHVTGIDVSEEMIARFREHLHGMPGVEGDLRVGDEAEVELPPASYDLALASMALHWIADRAGAVARMARALRPGGIIGVLAPGVGHDREYVETVKGLDPPAPEALYRGWGLAEVSAGDLEAYFAAAGIVPLDVWVERRVRREPVERLMARITTVGAHAWRSSLSDEEVDRQMVRIEAAVRARSGPRGFRYTFTKTFAIGRKPAGGQSSEERG